MYTSCPECGTVFRINTIELRVAEGYVRCGHCSGTFNAIASLADEPPSTVTLKQLALSGEAETGAIVASRAAIPEPAPEPIALPGFPSEPAGRASPPELQEAATFVPLPISEDTLEFDIPEGSWSHFFEGDAPSVAGPKPSAVATLHQPLHQTLQPTLQPPLPAELDAGGDDDQDSAHQADVGTGIGSDTADQAGLYRALSVESGSLDLNDDADWQALLKEVQDDDATPEPVFVIEEETGKKPAAEPALLGPSWDELGAQKIGAPAPLPADFAVDPPRKADALDNRVGMAAPAARGPLIPDPPFVWEPPAPPPVVESGRRWPYTVGSMLLASLLIVQILHQQRDELATNPTLNEPLQRTYAALGLPLWPTWDLRAYELRNSEAVADRSSPGALDILARIAVVGDEPVGLPLVRVTLRDRFSEPLGTRVFQPAEYLGENSRPREPLSAGTLIPVEISLRDPGAAAQGFDVDICIMSRREGIICRTEPEPFAR